MFYLFGTLRSVASISIYTCARGQILIGPLEHPVRASQGVHDRFNRMALASGSTAWVGSIQFPSPLSLNNPASNLCSVQLSIPSASRSLSPPFWTHVGGPIVKSDD